MTQITNRAVYSTLKSAAVHAQEQKAQKIAAFATAIEKRVYEINFDNLPVSNNDRSIGSRERAKLIRKLFSKLGLKGILVQCGTGSAYSYIQIYVPLPSRPDLPEGQTSHDQAVGSDHYRAMKVRQDILERIERILNICFPSDVDRSESMYDHFDFTWIVTERNEWM